MVRGYGRDADERDLHLEYENEFPNTVDCDDIHKRWKILLSCRRPKGTDLREDRSRVGNKLHDVMVSHLGEGDSAAEVCSREPIPDILWR